MPTSVAQRIHTLAVLSRPYNALHPILAIIASYGIAGGAEPLLLTGTCLSFLLLHSAITVWNDIEDRAIDAKNGISTVRGIERGGGLNRLKLSVAVLLTAGFLVGLSLPPTTTATLCSMAILGWLYNSHYRASRRPIASIVVLALSYGTVPVLMGASLGEVADATTFALFVVGWTAVRTSLSLLKDYKDVHGDAYSHKKTFLLVYGRRAVAITSILLAGVGYIGVVISAYFTSPEVPFLLLSSSIATVLLWQRRQLLTLDSNAALNQLFHLCLHLQLMFDGTIVVWLTSS